MERHRFMCAINGFIQAHGSVGWRSRKAVLSLPANSASVKIVHSTKEPSVVTVEIASQNNEVIMQPFTLVTRTSISRTIY